jgi:hypothetical protein
MKIAFLDRTFHKGTGSSLFFVTLLERLGTVQHFFVDHCGASGLVEIADADFDLVVLWQTDFCAPYFLARGKRTVIIPMYDGCARIPEVYWRAMSQARAVSFSSALHNKMSAHGIDSLYVQYFPDPKAFPVTTDFSTLRGFLWQRRPDQGITWELVTRLCDNLDSLHIHLPEDDGEDPGVPLLANITVSRWGSDSSAYVRHLQSANIFFAPRLTEGIGMANLEAMARGMCVIAHDDSTANEYLSDRQNGRIYHISSPEKLRLTQETAEKYGRAARKTVEVGHRKFVESIDDLLGFISSTPRPDVRYAAHFPHEAFLRAATMMLSNATFTIALLAKAGVSGAFPSGKRYPGWKMFLVRFIPLALIPPTIGAYRLLRRSFGKA